MNNLNVEIESDKLKSIIDNAAKNGYNDLVKDITRAFEMDYTSPFFNAEKEIETNFVILGLGKLY